MARDARSGFYPPSTPRSTHTTRSPSSRFPRSCTDASATTPREAFSGWVDGVRSLAGRHISVFVGTPRGQSHHPGLPLAEAYAYTHSASNLVLGGIAIAERHVAKEDEHHRMLAKQDQGCRFFITQSVYDAGSTKSLLSDYALSLRTSGRSPIPVVLTFSPCGSVPQALEFMKWLGISFPHGSKTNSAIRPTHWGASPSTCARGYSPMCRTMLAKSVCQSASTSRASPFESRRSTRRSSYISNCAHI